MNINSKSSEIDLEEFFRKDNSPFHGTTLIPFSEIQQIHKLRLANQLEDAKAIKKEWFF